MGRDKRNENKSEHFTKMVRTVMQTEAWRSLSPTAQALYPWVKFEWHGPKNNNNGKGDKYGAEWTRTEFRRQGVEYEDAPGVRSELYLSAASALQAGRVELPPDDKLERQFINLERRTTRGGRDVIDHSPGAHDDRANAAAGLIACLATQNPLATIRSRRLKGF